MSESIKETLGRLPAEPGCYLYRDAGGQVIYVGKARSLRPRVRSYFQSGAQLERKTRALVSEIAAIEFIVTDSEVEALILENSLIKENRPRFNVLLRDDKNFPYLKLTIKDEFPRVNLVRSPRSDGQSYFGPFLPASHARRTLRMIPRFFQVANCHLRFDGKQRPCLYYHLDQCLAPCAGKADPQDYAERVAQVKLFLEGRNEELREDVTTRMQKASDEQEYEKAARYRDMLRSVEHLASRQQMVSVGMESIDFWAEHREGDQAAVELFRMREGRVIGRREFTFEQAESPETFYDTILPQFYASEDPPREVMLPRMPRDAELMKEFLDVRAGHAVTLKAPTRGAKRQFLDLVAKNAMLAFEARFRAAHRHGVKVLEELRDVLGLPEVPFRIEGFDISHIQGAETRASLVVFEAGKPKKSDYRSFKIKTADAGDDYQAMREAVLRRYSRLAREGKRLPDLVLIDGGKGQLGAALEALEEAGLKSALHVVSIAKREEELFLESGGDPVLLQRSDPSLHLIQQVRDEAHRFALKHHRKARSKRTFGTALTKISGIGELTAKRLLQQFGSIDGVRQADPEALSAAIGPAKAKIVRKALNEKPN